MQPIAYIGLAALVLAALFAGAWYLHTKRRERATEWWRHAVEALDLPGDPDAETRRAEGAIDGQPFSVRQRIGKSPFGNQGRSDGIEIHYVLTFDLPDLPFQLTDHLDVSDPISLRSGMPRLDQQSIFETESPVDTLRTVDFKGVAGKLYRIKHRERLWRFQGDNLVVAPKFTFAGVGNFIHADKPEDAAERLREKAEQAADICNQLEEATGPRDVHWRPRTDMASAWKRVASDHGLSFACSQSPYEDAAIEGEWRDRTIVAHTAGKADRPPSRTIIEMAAPDIPLDLEFDLSGKSGASQTRDSLLAAIGRGEHDLSTDDTGSGFDRVYNIHGDRISTYGNLGRPGVEPAMLKLYRPDITVSVEPSKIRILLDGTPETDDELTELLDDLALAADALEGELTDSGVIEETGVAVDEEQTARSL